MTVASTSRAAYAELKAEGKLSKQQAQIIAVIQPGRDYSLQELVMISGLPINVVSARVNALKSKGELEHGATRKCSLTGRTVHPVQLPAVEGA